MHYSQLFKLALTIPLKRVRLFPTQGEKIQTILKAANVEVEPYWPGLFAKALEGVNPKELITNLSSGVGAAPAAGIFLISFQIEPPTVFELSNSMIRTFILIV